MSDLTAAPPPTAADPDSRDLARQGYRQELARTLGAFSAFAAGFSYLSILTGMFQTFHLGYGPGGKRVTIRVCLCESRSACTMSRMKSRPASATAGSVVIPISC